MKILYFYFILLFDICYCIEDNEKGATYWNKDVNYGDYHNDRRADYRGDYRDYGRYYDRKDHDDYEPIVRPCSLRDTNCIRRVFAQNSRCTPTAGHIPDPYKLPQVTYDISHANLTFTLNDVKFEGLNSWKIKDFYINKPTDSLVLEVEFCKLIVSAPRATVSFFQKGKASITVSDHSYIEYENISLTLTIPHFEGLQLSRGHVYSYIPDIAPKYTLGPSILAVKDPEARRALSALTTNMSNSLREVYVTQGPIFMSIFIRHTICDFGLQ